MLFKGLSFNVTRLLLTSKILRRGLNLLKSTFVFLPYRVILPAVMLSLENVACYSPANPHCMLKCVSLYFIPNSTLRSMNIFVVM